MSTQAVRGQPPGRAGRVWLQRRLDVASRGATMLETKLRILAAEEQRFSLLSARTEKAWVAAVRDAQRWETRAALLSGRRGLRLASASRPASIRVRWSSTMGVPYPDRALLVLPAEADEDATPDNSALVAARTSTRTAVEAAAAHAAATAALRALQAESRRTRRRLRALQLRRIPDLEKAIAGLAQTVEAQELEDAVRMQRFARAGAVAHPPPAPAAGGGRS